MAEFEEFPQRTSRDPGVTHRDPRLAPPWQGTGETRRDAPPTAGDPLMRLPGALAARFAVVGELPVQGAESDLLLVRDEAGGEFVVKVFRRGYSADRDVWAKLPALDSPHVVRILETGHADGRDYELTEYAPYGNLRALMGGPVPAQDVREMVAQLADGLERLHRAGIVHRDLKPENILVTGLDPVRLAIADFGLSRVIEQSVVFASSSRTLAYAAPESLSGQVSPARDWWSLGMIVRELVTGRPPFAGLSETVVVDHLATRPIDNGDLADPRLRLLCQGLLTRDPRRRWSAAEVARWLDGESPAVAEEPYETPQAVPGTGLPFAGRRFTDRGELARAIVERWDEAARYFFARGEAGEAWRALRDWLSAFPDDSRIELIDGYLSGGLPPDVKVLHLVRWLDPSLPPHYLGRRVASEDLPGLAILAQDVRHPDHRTACLIGRALWEHRLLPELAAFEGAGELAQIDTEWRAHVTEWNRLVRWLGDIPATGTGPVRAEGAGNLSAGGYRPASGYPGPPGAPGGGYPGPGATPGDMAGVQSGGYGAGGATPGAGGNFPAGGSSAAGGHPGTGAPAGMAGGQFGAGGAAGPSGVGGGVRLPEAGSVTGVPADDPPVVLLTLLALAARPEETGRRLAEAAERARAAVREPVPWFDQLVHWAGESRDPLRLLAVVRAAPEATLAAQAIGRDRQLAERQRQDREQHWAERERQREAGRGAAVTRAVLWTLPVLALWLFASWLVGSLFTADDDQGTQAVGGFQRSSGVPVGLLLAMAVVAWAVQCAAEVMLARRQGGDYLPYGPWSWLSRVFGASGKGLSKASQTLSASAQNTSRRGCGLVLLAVTVPLLLLFLLLAAVTAVASLLWLLVLIVVPLAHAVGAGVRLHHWRQEHDLARREALEGRPGYGWSPAGPR